MKSSTPGGSEFECGPPSSSSGVVQALLIGSDRETSGGPESPSSCSVANSQSIDSRVSEASAKTESVAALSKAGPSI